MARLRILLLCGAVAAGALDAWFYRQWNLNPDGVSYVDVARAFLTQGPPGLVSGYWSPLFPALIGGFFALIKPDMEWVFPVVRLAGFVVYLACVFSFDRLVRIALDAGTAREPRPDWTLPVILGSAWALFFMLVTEASGLHLVTPDIGVAAIVFFVAGELIALTRAPWTPGRWGRLGVVLGAGYWWKAILFPVGGIALIMAAIISLRRREGARGPAVCATAFAALALVLVVPVSRHVGRVTFGETGRLNQLWYVNNTPMVTSLCMSTGGRLTEPWAAQVALPPRLLDKPLTCLLHDAAPTATLPLWYDASVYYAGTRGYFSARETLVSVRNDLEYVRLAFVEWSPLAGMALLAALFAALATRAFSRESWPVLFFGAAPIAAYLIVYVELRHIVPFILLIALVMLDRLARSPSTIARAGLCIVAAGALLDTARRVATQQRAEAAILVHELRGLPRPEQPMLLASRALAAKGFVPGDRVAAMTGMWNVDWAQRIGLVVRAYVPEYTYPVTSAYDDLRDLCRAAEFFDALRAQRIKGVVTRELPGMPPPPGFEPLGESGFWLRLVGDAALAPGACAAPTRSSS